MTNTEFKAIMKHFNAQHNIAGSIFCDHKSHFYILNGYSLHYQSASKKAGLISFYSISKDLIRKMAEESGINYDVELTANDKETFYDYKKAGLTRKHIDSITFGDKESLIHFLTCLNNFINKDFMDNNRVNAEVQEELINSLNPGVSYEDWSNELIKNDYRLELSDGSIVSIIDMISSFDRAVNPFTNKETMIKDAKDYIDYLNISFDSKEDDNNSCDMEIHRYHDISSLSTPHNGRAYNDAIRYHRSNNELSFRLDYTLCSDDVTYSIIHNCKKNNCSEEKLMIRTISQKEDRVKYIVIDLVSGSITVTEELGNEKRHLPYVTEATIKEIYDILKTSIDVANGITTIMIKKQDKKLEFKPKEEK